MTTGEFSGKLLGVGDFSLLSKALILSREPWSNRFGSGGSTPKSISLRLNPSVGCFSTQNQTLQNSKQEQHDQFFKIMLIGPPESGKSAIIRQYCTYDFNQEYQSTFGMQNHMKNVTSNGLVVRLSIWDSPSDPCYQYQVQPQAVNADAVIFVYDATSKESLEKVTSLVEEVAPTLKPNTVLFAVANKVDRNTTRKDLNYLSEAVLEKYNLNLMTCSSKSSSKVNDLFERCMEMLIEKQSKVFEEYLKLYRPSLFDRPTDFCGVDCDNVSTTDYIDDEDDSESLKSKLKDIYYITGQQQKIRSSLKTLKVGLSETGSYQMDILPMFQEDKAKKIREAVKIIKENENAPIFSKTPFLIKISNLSNDSIVMRLEIVSKILSPFSAYQEKSFDYNV